MPEGDSVAGHAEQLRRALVNEVITSVEGSSAAVRSNSHRILGATVEGIRTVGKNLVIDLSGGYSIRVHLGMTGRWSVIPSGRPAPGAARLVLSAGGATAVCSAAPTIDVERTPALDATLSRLGPDVLGEFDSASFLRRARTRQSTSVGEMLLDQKVLAGIGNVYKSELLFLVGINPRTRVGEVDDRQLLDIADKAGSLMASNVGPKARSTTGSRARGQETWVYGRSGRPCRRCGAAIEMERQGERVTYWCPVCQPL